MKGYAKLALVTLLAVAITLSAGCSKGKPAPESKTKGGQETAAGAPKAPETPASSKPSGERQVRIAGGSAGGVYYMVAASLGQLIEQKVPGTKCFIEGTAGSTANLQLISTGKADLGIINNQQASMAMEGVGWAEGKDFKKFSALFPIYPSVMTVVTLDEKIKSIKDLNGKSVAPGTAASDGSVVMNAIVDVFKIKPSSVQYTGYGEIAQLLGDRKVDVAIIVGGHPHSQTQQLEQTHKANYISLSEDECRQLLAVLPAWKKVVLEPEGLKYMKPGYVTIGNWSYVGCREDLDEELAYKVVKEAWENRTQLLSAVAALKDMKPENIPAITQKYHPGALKYYQEKGWKIQ